MTSRRTLGAAVAAISVLAVVGVADAKPYSFITIDGSASPFLFGTAVTDVNNTGLATGYYVLAGPGGPEYHAFTVHADGSDLTTIDLPGPGQTAASGLNDAGDVVGVSFVPYASGNGFLRAPGGATSVIDPNLGGLTSAYSEASGINGAGTVVGFFTPTLPPSLDLLQAYSHGFIDAGGVYSEFDVPAGVGFGTQLISINSAGMISGNFLGFDFLPHGFVYTPGVGFWYPPIPGATEVGDLNESGDFVGSVLTLDLMSPTGRDAAGFVFSGGVFSSIAVPGAFSTEPLGLNDHGQVSGLYIDRTGLHGFIATAVPEPASWMLMILGFGAVGAAQRRRRPLAAPQS